MNYPKLKTKTTLYILLIFTPCFSFANKVDKFNQAVSKDLAFFYIESLSNKDSNQVESYENLKNNRQKFRYNKFFEIVDSDWPKAKEIFFEKSFLGDNREIDIPKIFLTAEDKPIEKRKIYSVLWRHKNLLRGNVKSSSGLIIFLVISLLINTVLIFLIIKTIKNIENLKKTADRELKKANRELYKKDVKYQELLFDNKNHIQEIEDLEKNVSEKDLNKENIFYDKMKNKSSTDNIENNSPINTTEYLKSENSASKTEFKAENKEILYFETPIDEDYFDYNLKQLENLEDNLYKIELGQHEGLLTINQDASLVFPFNNPDLYFKGACKAVNKKTPNSRSIKVVEKGIIKKEGNKLIIETPIKIEFL